MTMNTMNGLIYKTNGLRPTASLLAHQIKYFLSVPLGGLEHSFYIEK